ncbi:solute carrier family 35 member B1 isoform X2 [Apus apus]|uniref:solute carrier family 35 member B1 isoform X2 n=1 Tax=Apus apus TaxID=8895 RepID=UPI0021F8DDDD|nr:solute carrier family 35 member B1 isoform X2 [Apus apus]
MKADLKKGPRSGAARGPAAPWGGSVAGTAAEPRRGRSRDAVSNLPLGSSPVGAVPNNGPGTSSTAPDPGGRVLDGRWSQSGRMRLPAPPPQPPGALRDAVLELPPALSGRAGAMGASGSGAALPERLRLPVCFLGVFACYFYYGILQESITRGRYGEGAKQEKFRYALTLVFIQCVINAAFAKLLIRCLEPAKADRTRSWLYAACSLSYLGAMVSSNSALQFVSYPTQVLGKSCKPIPVAGVALFLYKPKKGAGSEDHVFGYGELLLLLSLTLDGLTGVSQDHMRAHYQTGSNHMMLNVNLWSTLFLGAGILFTGELWEFLSFTERYPSIIYNILLFGLTSALGQSFIFMTVVYFGPLTCSIITTTRKFFTILASVVLFANPISSMQWVGTILVFLGLGLDAKFGKVVKKTSH